MKWWQLPGVWAFFVWLAATGFFMLLGDRVLVEPSDEFFVPWFLGIEAATGVLLYAVLSVYRLVSKFSFAGVRLAIWGTALGLALDTVSLWQHQIVFSAFTDGQVVSFAIWMAFAYVLFLLIPIWLDRTSVNKLKV